MSNKKNGVINKELFFENLGDFWKYAMQESNAYNKCSRTDVSAWSGNVTWEEAKILALHGWKEGMKEIEKYRAKISPLITPKVMRPQPVYSHAGYVVDIGYFLANQPECFIHKQLEEKKEPGRIIKVVCSVSFSADISPETIIQRGAMICALVEAIEYAGDRAEVICNNATSIDGTKEHREGQKKEEGWFEISVVVKKANQPLEMTDLAFCLAHPAMLRKMIFSVKELEGWADFTRGGYGYPSAATDKGDIYIEEIFSGTVSDNQAIDWVLSQLENLGIKIEKDQKH
ncbi:MAG: hypothetical protein RML72_03200 [Bacteroidia bacterium]|nr:hypothetical protein [Bacteroidia bacterium]MDW8157869.1 hypothetical protein [Bacteroidia bacterium]